MGEKNEFLDKLGCASTKPNFSFAFLLGLNYFCGNE
jgi:hypothetical protein